MATSILIDTGVSGVSPEAGEVIRIFDEEVVIKVTGAETAGAYAVVTISVAPGGGPPLHAHPGNETFSVLAGTFLFTQRDVHGVSTFHGGSGAVFHAPGGTPHRFENVGPTRSTLLIVASADTVDFLRELGATFPPGAQPDMEQMLTIGARYGIATYYGEEASRPEPPKDGATSERARALAWRFEQANEALIVTIAACSPEQWRASCADTGWTVGVQAHHIAVGEAAITDQIRAVAKGQAYPPVTVEMLDAINARHAAESANVTLAETIALLRHNGALAASQYRRLTDEQLARPATLMAGADAMSVAQWIEALALGEIERHGEFLRRAIKA
ncbi:MAG: cupin domain-containing protein [Thermomicrobiales bacterium]